MHAVTQSCVLFLWLQTLILVKTQDCTLKQFLSSDLYDANFDTTNLEASYSSGRQVIVGCNVGYSGFFKLICVAGSWESRGTKCQPQQCPVIRVDNNVQVAGDPEEATYGNVVRFSCKSRSEILFGPSEIYCNEYGEWSDSAPKCQEIKCSIPEIENGFVPGAEREYNEHEVLHFECNPKYTRTEDRPSKCTKFGDRAEWSPTPVCEPTKCRLKLPALKGTSYDPPFRNAFFPGETLRVNCDEKYWIVRTQYTTTETTCEEDGQWSIRPICKEVVCSNQRGDFVYNWYARWGYRLTLGDTVRYTCNSGYKSTDGSNLAKCTRDGWRPDPLCQEVTCDQLDIPHAVIQNHRKLIYKENEQAFYNCIEGYRGNPTRVCRENGWTGDSECTAPIGCGKPPPLEDGDLKESVRFQYQHNEKVEYICQNLYIMRDNSIKTCINGEWIGEMRCLKPCTVDIATMARHNIIFRNTYDKKLYSPHMDEIEFQCARGRRHDRQLSMRQRCIDGVMHLPTCL